MEGKIPYAGVEYMKYIVPEYYKNFQCKCGECRRPCCEGWPIRISMKEYFQLIGVSCSKKLRNKLDCALKICDEPSKEGYALLSTDWRGSCMLHREDGLCALQAELGVGHLPNVCRLYPRNAKQLTQICECSCSNSCEQVIELLMDLKEPMRFEEADLPFQAEFKIDLPPKKYEYCQKSIAVLQDRRLSLPERFIILGEALNCTGYSINRTTNRSLAFQILSSFDQYYESSVSISEYCEASQSYFGIKDNFSTKDLNDINMKYLSASKHLVAILPDWQLLFEQLLVNHMFYNNFPYTDHHNNMHDPFLSLVIMYSFLRFNLLGFMADKPRSEELTDFLAAMFRLIEHSNFNDIAVSLFERGQYPEQDSISQLLSI